MNKTVRPFRLKTADLVLVCGLLVMAAVLFVVLRVWSAAGRTVQVQVDGVTAVTLPLDIDTTYTIDGVGGKNTLVIADGKASVTDATCPDGICVRHRAIDKAGQSIICLPHKVVVSVVGESIVDAEAG
jgi:hypothetical protein